MIPTARKPMVSAGAAPIRRPLSSAIFSQEVRTYEELISGISRIIAIGASGTTAAGAGAELVFCAPIIFKSPIILPPQCAGTTIRCAGSIPITAASSLPFAFIVRASNVRILGVVAIPNGANDMFGFEGFVSLQSSTTQRVQNFVLDGTSFESSAAASGTFLESSGTFTSGARVTNNRATQNNGSGVFCRIDGDKWLVSNNTVTEYESIRDTSGGKSAVINGNSTDVASMTLILGQGFYAISGNGLGGDVTLTTSSGNSTIVGNVIAGDVTTTADAGANTIVGNTVAGSINNRADDYVGLNAP